MLRDEQPIACFSVDTGEIDWYHADETAEPGEHVYRAEVRLRREVKQFPHNIAQAAGAMAYSSPIWVTVGGGQAWSRSGRLSEPARGE